MVLQYRCFFVNFFCGIDCAIRFIGGKMDEEVVVLDVTLRPFGEMVAEILRNEGIEAHLMGTSFLSTAYLMDAGLLGESSIGWRLMVPADQAERAREVIAQLQAE